MSEKADEILDRLKEMKADRSLWDSLWQEVGEYENPRRADIVSSQPKGGKRDQKIYDPVGMWLTQTLASGLHGHLSSPMIKWFKIRAKEDDLMERHEVKEWYADSNREMSNIFRRSNFYEKIHELYLDLASLNTAMMYEEEYEETVVRFDVKHVKHCYIAQNVHGKVDTLFREFPMTARQIGQKWKTNLPKCVKEALEREERGKEFEMLHATYPREDFEPKRIDRQNMPFASVWMEKSENHIIDEGGYREFPYSVVRWLTASGEVYGRGPGIDGRPWIKMANEIFKTLIIAGQKSVSPALQVPFEGFLLPIRTVPNGLTYTRRTADPRAEIKKIPGPEGGFPYGLELYDRVIGKLEQMFFIDLFLMLDILRREKKGQITATEILERAEEKMVILGPTLGRIITEVHQPVIKRTFNICLRTGRFKPIPEAIKGEEWEVDWISPLAKAQQMMTGQSVNRTLAAVGQVAEAFPGAMDIIDMDKTIRYLADLYGFPPDLMRSEDEVAQVREQRRKAQEAMQAAAMASEAASKAAEIEKARPGTIDQVIEGATA